jgi:hypothetical protein
MVYKSGNQTGVNATVGGGVKIGFDSEQYDTSNFHDNVTNNTRLTVPSGVSRVRVFGQLSKANVSGATTTLLTIQPNLAGGATVGIAVQNVLSSGTASVFQVCSPVLSVAANDYFELQVNQTTDTSIDFQADGTLFGIEVVE